MRALLGPIYVSVKPEAVASGEARLHQLLPVAPRRAADLTVMIAAFHIPEPPVLLRTRVIHRNRRDDLRQACVHGV